MDDLTGETLGPYRVLDRIGAGGMATVYRAYHAAMDRYVAIKVLPRHLARDPNFHARFLREARTIARLEHRHILTVHDVSEVDGVPFLVMRYTNSGDLSHLIATRSLTLARTVELVGQVAEALAYAHRQGVIHRDVKPANVLIGSDGDALLTDFGIAKIYADTLQLTGDNQMVGTPAYMAPEQLQGQPVDARTDVYALGVVLYQAITGDPPFIAETPLAVALMHLHNPLRPPRQINPAIPEALERVVLRAMAKNPTDRFQTADEMARALRGVVPELGASGDQPVAYRAPLPDPLPQAAAGQEPTQLGKPRPAPPPPSNARQPAVAYQGPTAVGQAGPPAHSPNPGEPLQPARPAQRRPIPLPLLIGAGAIVLVVAAALLVLLRRPGAAALATPVAADGAAPTAGAAPASELRYPAASTKINDVAVLGDAVWAATDGGLVRWGADGSGQLFTPDNGLPFDEPGAIVSAPDGTLWIGGGGVAHIRPANGGIRVVASYSKDDGLGSGVIRTLLVDADGSVWAGGPQESSRFALSHFSGDSWHTDELPTDDPALKPDELQIQSILRSRDGALWLGLRKGVLLRWDGKSWARFSPADEAAPAQDADTRIRRLVQARDGTLWAAASDLGLLRFDAAQARWQRVAAIRDGVAVRAVAQLADGSLWVGGDGLIVGSADGGQTWADTNAGGGIGSDIGSLVQDAGGRVWAGAYNGGMSVFDGTQWRQLQR